MLDGLEIELVFYYALVGFVLGSWVWFKSLISGIVVGIIIFVFAIITLQLELTLSHLLQIIISLIELYMLVRFPYLMII